MSLVIAGRFASTMAALLGSRAHRAGPILVESRPRMPIRTMDSSCRFSPAAAPHGAETSEVALELEAPTG
jgi:hypothetical protein